MLKNPACAICYHSKAFAGQARNPGVGTCADDQGKKPGRTCAGKMELSQGEHEIIEDVTGFELPLKIVVSVEGEITTVITNYPLKKGRKQ